MLGINMSLVMTEVNLLLTYATEKHYCCKELLTPESMESILGTGRIIREVKVAVEGQDVLLKALKERCDIPLKHWEMSIQ